MSVVSEETPAKLTNVPVAVGSTMTVTVALPPLASDPRLQVTTLLLASSVQLPVVDVAETKFAAKGRMSVTTGLVAAAGPLLVTPIV